MHNIKASNGISNEALRERGLGERETTSQQRRVQRGQQANDGEPMIVVVKKGLGWERERERERERGMKLKVWNSGKFETILIWYWGLLNWFGLCVYVKLACKS